MTALKLLAKDSDDLGIVAAALQDSILRIADISYNKTSRSLSLRLWRYRNEGIEQERVLTALRFDDIMDVKVRDIERSDPEALLVFLDAKFTKGKVAPGGEILLQFAGGGELQLSVEAIEVILSDVSEPKKTDKVPIHPEFSDD
ncbi:MAG: DUF2948 family protein [Maricaulaceae bacterium]